MPCALLHTGLYKIVQFSDTPDILKDGLYYEKILINILFWNKTLKLVVDIIFHFTRKFPFVTFRFTDKLESLAFTRSIFLDWNFWGGRTLWVWWRRFWWWVSLPFIFFLFVFVWFLCCSSERGLIIIIVTITSTWLLPPLLLIPSIVVTDSVVTD